MGALAQIDQSMFARCGCGILSLILFFVFALVERKNEKQKIASTMLPQAIYHVE
jgi:hypothetical protein